MEAAQLQYVEPSRVVIDGVPSDTMLVHAAGRALGHLRGVVVDPVNQRLRYLVVRAARMFGRLTLVPAVAARVDKTRRVIELDISGHELQALRNFTLDDLMAIATRRVKSPA
jgi:hypothetical protein